MANFNPDSLNAAQDVLMDLKNKTKQAEQRGDAFTFSLMNELIRHVSPIVTKAFARREREERAEFNAAAKALRAKFREDAERSRDNAGRNRED
jgi:hypothetical protein